MRMTIQSLPFAAHAPAGTVTVANPSGDVTDDEEVALVPPWAGGGVPPELGVHTVKLIWNADHLPEESVNPPVSVCRPGASEPVL